MNSNPNWHVVYCKPNFERKVSEGLTHRGILNYCPFHTTSQKLFKQVKLVYKPLFDSYVFVNCSESQLDVIKQIKGVINCMYWLNKPVVVSGDEIACIQDVLQRFTHIQIEKLTALRTPLSNTKTGNDHIYFLTSLKCKLVATGEKVPVQALPATQPWTILENTYMPARRNFHNLVKTLTTAIGNKTNEVPIP